MELPPAEAIDNLVSEVKELIDSSDKEWKEIGTENEVSVYTRNYKNYPMKMAKATGVIKYGVGEVKTAMLDFENRHKWDPVCKSAANIRKIGEAQVYYLTIPQIAIVSSRDVVAFYVERGDETSGYLVAAKNVENGEKEIPVKKDTVRGELILYGIKLEPITVEGSIATRVTVISIIDLKGMVPNIGLKAVFMKGSAAIHGLRGFIATKHAGK